VVVLTVSKFEAKGTSARALGLWIIFNQLYIHVSQDFREPSEITEVFCLFFGRGYRVSKEAKS